MNYGQTLVPVLRALLAKRSTGKILVDIKILNLRALVYVCACVCMCVGSCCSRVKIFSVAPTLRFIGVSENS